MKYFAYGSNMAPARLRARVGHVGIVGVCMLVGYDLRFHKKSLDGSAKCDAFRTGDPEDRIQGVVFELDTDEIAMLDRFEGVGDGYQRETVVVVDAGKMTLEAFTYTATRIADSLQPFSWYKHHVLVGARSAGLDSDYIASIESIPDQADPDRARAAREMSIYET